MCIPTIDPVLSPQIYEMVLYDFLKTDYSVSFVCLFLYATCSNILSTNDVVYHQYSNISFMKRATID